MTGLPLIDNLNWIVSIQHYFINYEISFTQDWNRVESKSFIVDVKHFIHASSLQGIHSAAWSHSKHTEFAKGFVQSQTKFIAAFWPVASQKNFEKGGAL